MWKGSMRWNLSGERGVLCAGLSFEVSLADSGKVSLNLSGIKE